MQPRWLTIDIGFASHDKPIHYKVIVPGWAVKPTQMLPAVYELSRNITSGAIDESAQAAKSVSCTKGCSACCRQLVPLTETEVYFIVQLIEQQPDDVKANIKERFALAIATLGEDWLEVYSGAATAPATNQLVAEYFTRRISCPFLVEDTCSIHSLRPLACREYLVTSSPVHCDEGGHKRVQRLPMPLSLLERLAGMTNGGPIFGTQRFLPLIFALKWAETHPERFSEKPGLEWISAFCGR